MRRLTEGDDGGYVVALMLEIDWHPRVMRHPGPIHPERLHSEVDGIGKPARCVLPAGETLFGGLSCWLPNGSSAIISLLGGVFERCTYCLAAPDPTGTTVATYTPWREVRDAHVLGGSATLGISDVGDPMVHCHSVFKVFSNNKPLGGHLDPGATVVGRQGLVVMVHTLPGIEIRQTPDRETNHSLFTPHKKGRP